jgi:hypothetical protein
MGKKKSSGPGGKTPKLSSGNRRLGRAKQALKRLEMKIARWKRNQDLPEKVSKWDKDQNVRLRSRHNEWNTEGLEKCAEFLRDVIKRGKVVKKSWHKR